MSSGPWANAASTLGGMINATNIYTAAQTMAPSAYNMGTLKFQMNSDPAFLSITGSASRPLEANMDGPLPQVGERVELVCVSRGDNEMGFALRVIPESYK